MENLTTLILVYIFRGKKDKSRPGRGEQCDKGYCELCCINYNNLKHHLQSASHIAFTTNDENYAALDKLINGTTLS